MWPNSCKNEQNTSLVTPRQESNSDLLKYRLIEFI